MKSYTTIKSRSQASNLHLESTGVFHYKGPKDSMQKSSNPSSLGRAISQIHQLTTSYQVLCSSYLVIRSSHPSILCFMVL
ncbi:hypothetical protein VNO77_43451 [Canavalia gladiata]|uniref:Uncharacterized protein n=1 Tax=Canavalia gladiata TaxID=3824 RepID=A0AAN9JU89_CANGL